MLGLIQITKEHVDSFKSGQEMPSCQIRAEWTKLGKPSQHTYPVTLKGAKKPKNYFYIELDSIPPYTTQGEFMSWHKPLMCLVTSPFGHHFQWFGKSKSNALYFRYLHDIVIM